MTFVKLVGEMHQQKCCQAAKQQPASRFLLYLNFYFHTFKHFSSGAGIVMKVDKIKERGRYTQCREAMSIL